MPSDTLKKIAAVSVFVHPRRFLMFGNRRKSPGSTGGEQKTLVKIKPPSFK